MQEEISAKPRKACSIPPSPQPHRHHISDSQFRFSYDMPTGIQTRPLTVPVWTPMGDLTSQPTILKRAYGRRPDGNPVTGEGYEPQHYRPSYYGPLKALGDTDKHPVKEDLLGERAQDDCPAPVLNSAPLLRPAAERPVSATGRRRVPPGGYSNGLW